MKIALFLVYAVVEIGAFVGLVYAIGFWWTVLVTLVAVVVGVTLLRRQGSRVFADLRRAASGTPDSPRPAPDSVRTLTDTALLALSALLLVVPGIVTTVVGIALLLSPVRAVARPLVAAFGARRVVTAMNRVNPRGRGPVVDGEVVDVTGPDGRQPGGPADGGWRSLG